ncbi:PQQ-binding-like beta-propeller repeat protein [Streptomyces sp. NPDC058001]|uniref:protein kinase domain-containing protein n=1 Tax=Streptomyces sp. NPDC058001 TaxID=3346300 RepID=UPI0036EA9AC1
MQLRGGDPESIGGYPLEKRLGAGGMGTVYLARTASGRPVAIKLIHRQFADDEEFRIRFRQEVSAARRVSGVFTAAVVDADPETDHPWMATAYISGPTLAQRIAEAGALTGAELRTLAIGLAEALREIHRAGVVHRDLKPSNVVLSPDGPRVIDFGISRAAGHQTLTMTGRVIGTPPFMSPEQLQSPRGVGPRSDVFSLATLLVYASTGQGPFDADSPYMTAYQVVHEAPELGAVPEMLREIVEPCLAKDPEGRPSADELLAQLRALPEDLGPTAEESGTAKVDEDTCPDARPDSQPDTPDTRPSAEDTDRTHHSDSSSRSRVPALRSRLPRRIARTRRRTVMAVVVAVAAIVAGATLMKSGGGADAQEPMADDRTTSDSRIATPTGAALPDGFRPWLRTVRGGQDIADELRCVAHGTAVYCGGGGVLATRLRTSDGTEVWRRTSPGVPMQGVHLVGATEDAVVGYRLPADNSDRFEIVGLSADKGRERWSTRVNGHAAVLTGQSLFAVMAGSTVLYVDADRSRIEARSARDGTVLWTSPFRAGTECVPFMAGATPFAMCAPRTETDASEVRSATVHTLDPKTGALGAAMEIGERAQPMGTVAGRPVLLQERRVGAGFDGWAKVIRIDPATGRVTAFPLKRYSGTTAGFAGGTLYFTGATGRVTAVDPANGKERWTTQTAAESASGPVAAHGVVYFSSTSGRVAALDARDGTLLWGTDPRADSVSGEVAATPRVTIAGRALVVAAGENTMFSFDTAEPPKSG